MKRYKLIILLLYIGQPLSLYLGIDMLRFLGLFALVVGFLDYFTLPKSRIFVGSQRNLGQTWLLILGILIYGVSCIRAQTAGASVIGGLNTTMQALLMVAITYAYTGRNYFGLDFKLTQKDATYQLFWPMGAMVMVNVLGYVVGLRPLGHDAGEEQVSSLLASLLGLNIGRSGFFLTGHPNGFAIFLGWVLLMGILMLWYGSYRRQRRLFLRMTLLCGVFALLVLDSRGTVASVTICLLGALLLRRTRWWRLAKVLVLIMPMVSLNVVYLLRSMAENETTEAISRHDGEVATGNGRTIFWEYCVEELTDFKDEHVMGYGQGGHITSGVALDYAWYLGYPTYTHNFVYQTIFDMGYVGLLVLLLIMYLMARNGVIFLREGYGQGLIFVMFPLYFQFSGLFESTFGQFNHTYTYTFILVAAFNIFLYNEFIKYKRRTQAQVGVEDKIGSEKVADNSSSLNQPQ